MRFIYNIEKKYLTASLLALIFCVGVVIKIVDNHHLSELDSSFSSVYEDRLIVESYIYKLTDHLHRKKSLIHNAVNHNHFLNVQDQINNHDQAITQILADYEKTKLTKAESVCFQNLKTDIADLLKEQNYYLRHGALTNEMLESRARIDRAFNRASDNLRLLSGIQLSEGKFLTDNSKKLVSGSTILTQLELALFVGIGLFVMALLLASKSIVPKTNQYHRLN